MYSGLKIKRKHLKGYVKKDYWTPEFEAMLDQIDRWFISGDERSDRLREVTVAAIPLHTGNTIRQLSVKYTNPMYIGVKINAGKFVRSIFNPSKAEQSWKIAHTLLEHQICVPAPVAFSDQRRFGVLLKCYYMAEYLEKAENLLHCLSGFREKASRYPEATILQLKKRRILEETGRLIGRLHANGFRHGDLGIGNMMIFWKDTETCQIYLVDIETITQHRHLPEQEIAYDLACLFHSVQKILSGMELRIVMRSYLEANPPLRPHRKRLMKEIWQQFTTIHDRYCKNEEKKSKYLENLKAGERVLFIDSVKEDGMMEIIKTLKRRFPMSEFTLLIIEEGDFLSQIQNLSSYLKKIKQGAYGIVIDWRGSLLTALLTSMSGAELRMGYRSRNLIKNRVLYNFLVRVHSWSMDRQIRLLAPLKALGVML